MVIYFAVMKNKFGKISQYTKNKKAFQYDVCWSFDDTVLVQIWEGGLGLEPSFKVPELTPKSQFLHSEGSSDNAGVDPRFLVREDANLWIDC